MTPEQLEKFEQMEKRLIALERVENLSTIENSKRRFVVPLIGESIQKSSTGDTSGVLQSVNEGGVATYNVADAYDGTMIVEDQDGNQYKLGYYTA